MSGAIAVEPAGLAALDLLAALHARSFEEPWDRASIARLLALPNAFALIATAHGDAGAEPVGLAIVRAAADEGEILTLGVVPERRRRGAGRALVTASMVQLEAAGATKVFLEVARHNTPARKLYRALGFVEVGERPDYYRQRGAPVGALVLRRDLAAA